MKSMKRIMMLALVAISTIAVSAQQVNTLYFLENAPMRHTINPAFQPVSQGYVNFSPLGWMTGEIGNNSLTLSDVLKYDASLGKTITPLHPNADRQAALKAFKKVTLVNGGLTIGLVNFGFRIKKKGYLTIGLNERIPDDLYTVFTAMGHHAVIYDRRYELTSMKKKIREMIIYLLKKIVPL